MMVRKKEKEDQEVRKRGLGRKKKRVWKNTTKRVRIKNNRVGMKQESIKKKARGYEIKKRVLKRKKNRVRKKENQAYEERKRRLGEMKKMVQLN